jgi:hypothetical protein
MTKRTYLWLSWWRVTSAQFSNNRLNCSCILVGAPPRPYLALLSNPGIQLVNRSSKDLLKLTSELIEHPASCVVQPA